MRFLVYPQKQMSGESRLWGLGFVGKVVGPFLLSKLRLQGRGRGKNVQDTLEQPVSLCG